MRPLAFFLAVALVVISANSAKAVLATDGLILIESYTHWSLEILSDGSGVLIYGSGLPNGAAVPKGTFDFQNLSTLLPSVFNTATLKPEEEKYCFQITVSPPHSKQHDELVGHSYEKKLLDSLFVKALAVGKPFAPQSFKNMVSHVPVTTN